MLLSLYAAGIVLVGTYLTAVVSPKNIWGVAGIATTTIACASWPVIVLAAIAERL